VSVKRINLSDTEKDALWQWLRANIDLLEEKGYSCTGAAQLATKALGFTVTVSHIDACTDINIVRKWYGREYLAPGQGEELREQIDALASRLGEMETKLRESRSLTGAGHGDAEECARRCKAVEELQKEAAQVMKNVIDRVREGEERLKKLEAWRDRVSSAADERAVALENDLLALMEEVEALKRQRQPAPEVKQEQPEPAPAKPLSVAEQLAALPMPAAPVAVEVEDDSFDAEGYVNAALPPGDALDGMPANKPKGEAARTTPGLSVTGDSEAEALARARAVYDALSEQQKQAMLNDSIGRSDRMTEDNSVSWLARGFRCRLAVIEDEWHTSWAVEVRSRRDRGRQTGGHRNKALAEQVRQLCSQLTRDIGQRPPFFHPSKGGLVGTMVCQLTNAERDARDRLRREKAQKEAPANRERRA